MEQCRDTHEAVVGASQRLHPSEPGFVVVVGVGMRDW